MTTIDQFRTHPLLSNVIWIEDHLKDYDNVYTDTVAWWKEVAPKWDDEEYFKNNPPQALPNFKRRF
jgi:hypothetical protein